MLRVVYRVEVEGIEHVTAALPHAVIAANHAWFLDGLLLGALLPGNPVFAIDTFIARKWSARPFLLVVDAMPIDPTNPLSIRAMIRAVEAGASCVIFPEGRITVTGGLMKVYDGPALIAERTRAALVLVRIDGAELTPFSRLAGKVPRHLFPRIRITIFPPRRLSPPEGLVGRARRAAMRRALRDEMVRRRLPRRASTPPVRRAARGTRARRGGHLIADDVEQRPISYRSLIAASVALGGSLKRLADPARVSDCCCRRRARRSSRSLPCRTSDASRPCSTSRPVPQPRMRHAWPPRSLLSSRHGVSWIWQGCMRS